jgi:phosphoribosylanthranilate isomerase
MQVKVKICGNRSLEAAKVAINFGADFMGFIFVKSSKRYIDPTEAQDIMMKIKHDSTVGVFQNEDLFTVQTISQELMLDFVQLHGTESPEYCRQIDVPVMKVFSVGNDFSVEEIAKQMEQYEVAYYMLDRKVQGKGEMVDLEKAAALAKRFPIIYSGGLTPENVGEVVEKVKPFGVDVAGGIETDGMQDVEKIKLFLKNAKGESV